ncbi:hypothetical protein D3C87_1988160 [compost metagenome]
MRKGKRVASNVQEVIVELDMMPDDFFPAVGDALFEVGRFSHLALLRSLGFMF